MKWSEVQMVNHTEKSGKSFQKITAREVHISLMTKTPKSTRISIASA